MTCPCTRASQAAYLNSPRLRLGVEHLASTRLRLPQSPVLVVRSPCLRLRIESIVRPTCLVVRSPCLRLGQGRDSEASSLRRGVKHDSFSVRSWGQAHLDKFSEQGLRTLVFAGRELTQEEFEYWSSEYDKASLLSDGREDTLRQVAMLTRSAGPFQTRLHRVRICVVGVRRKQSG